MTEERLRPAGTGHLLPARQSVRSAAELWHLAVKFVSHPHIGRRKTAVLCPDFRLDHARFFALRAERQGGNVQAFSSYEEAMDWLLGSQPGKDG